MMVKKFISFGIGRKTFQKPYVKKVKQKKVLKMLKTIDNFLFVAVLCTLSALITRHYVVRHDYEPCWATPLDIQIAIMTSNAENGYIDLDKIGKDAIVGPNCIEVNDGYTSGDWVMNEYRKKTKYEFTEEYVLQQKSKGHTGK
jgi:hypothetical protein